VSTSTRASYLLDNNASKSHVAKNCKSASQPSDDRDVTHPISPLTFELNSVPGTYAYEWFDPAAHSVVEAGTVTIATRHTFAAPFPGAAEADSKNKTRR
jgi:hypothetical protein